MLLLTSSFQGCTLSVIEYRSGAAVSSSHAMGAAFSICMTTATAKPLLNGRIIRALLWLRWLYQTRDPRTL